MNSCTEQVGTMEALNTQLSGELKAFSQQYFVDCTFKHSGCAGGTVNAGYKLTMMRQYIVSAEEWPFTGKCEKDIRSFQLAFRSQQLF